MIRYVGSGKLARLSAMFSIALLVGLAAVVALAQDTKPAAGTINGTVTKANKAMSGVAVRLFTAASMPESGIPGVTSHMTVNQAGNLISDDAGDLQSKGGTGAPKPAKLPTPLRTVTSDKDGKFTFKGVLPGDYVVAVINRNLGSGRANVTVAEGADADASIELTPPSSNGGSGNHGGPPSGAPGGPPSGQPGGPPPGSEPGGRRGRRNGGD